MAGQRSAFPIRNDVEVEASPIILGLNTDDEVFDSLASATARSLVEHVYEEQTTASNLAAAVNTSLQNAHYHLDRLCETGLIDVVDTWYSERGVEMKVYGPAADPLVICVGDSNTQVRLRRAVTSMSTRVS